MSGKMQLASNNPLKRKAPSFSITTDTSLIEISDDSDSDMDERPEVIEITDDEILVLISDDSDSDVDENQTGKNTKVSSV